MKRRLQRGFTLIEVMVALVIMSVLAIMSWQGVSGMASAQTITQARSDEVLQLQTALAQWQTDLDAVTDTQLVSPLDFNGVALRMTRRDQQGPPKRGAAALVALAIGGR
jgi:general secretion pathway protein J